MKNLLMKRGTTYILIGVLLVGLSLLLYPSISNYWNSFRSTRAIEGYKERLDPPDYEKINSMFEAAQKYNEKIFDHPTNYIGGEAKEEEYKELLRQNDDGMIGFITVPRAQIKLPVYHGTSEAVLAQGVGHLEGSSIPVGGENTHSILMGHRGLPSAKLFDNLVKMREGDIFEIHVLDKTLSYEVDQIRIVEPDDIEELEITRGRDYCTLITCTPYAVNTERLLVRGKRVDNVFGDIGNAYPVEEYMVSIFFFCIFALLFSVKRLCTSLTFNKLC